VSARGERAGRLGDRADLAVRPVDADGWADLAALFGPSGAYSGCWCMWWRIPGGEFARNGNAGNLAALRELVDAGKPVGLLGYAGGDPVGFCALAPRPAYGRLLRSPALRPADPDEPLVWSVPCFFVARGRRRTGVATGMLVAAVAHAAAAGAAALEGYPVEAGGRPAAELFTGTVAMFARHGFEVTTRPGTGRRVVMRRDLTRPRPPA
jgi:GNAT superfamily N-acetyltransferase